MPDIALRRFYIAAAVVTVAVVAWRVLEPRSDYQTIPTYSPGSPMDQVREQQLNVTDSTMTALRNLLDEAKFTDLPGDIPGERARLEASLNALLERLIAGAREHPSKRWVLGEFEQELVDIMHEDTEAREPYGEYLEQIMTIFGITSSDGLLNAYL